MWESLVFEIAAFAAIPFTGLNERSLVRLVFRLIIADTLALVKENPL
jgi:hypothetical protein